MVSGRLAGQVPHQHLRLIVRGRGPLDFGLENSNWARKAVVRGHDAIRQKPSISAVLTARSAAAGVSSIREDGALARWVMSLNGLDVIKDGQSKAGARTPVFDGEFLLFENGDLLGPHVVGLCIFHLGDARMQVSKACRANHNSRCRAMCDRMHA